MATPAAPKSEKPADVIVEKPTDEALPVDPAADAFPEDATVEPSPLGRHPWLIERDKAEAELAGK